VDKIKIVIKDKYAKLFVNDAKQPSLVVTESLGENTSGAFGLICGCWYRRLF